MSTSGVPRPSPLGKIAKKAVPAAGGAPDDDAGSESTPTDKAPVRSTPDRSGPAIETLTGTVRTLAEFEQGGERWRVCRLADGRTGFLIRDDLTPVTPGGDPAVDAPYIAYSQRQTPGADPVACKPYTDAAVKADRAKAYVAWKGGA